MIIRTPDNSYFGPDGTSPGQGMILAASYAITEDVIADFGPTTVPLFVPSDGLYLVTGFVKTNTSTAATGSIVITVEQPGGTFSNSMSGFLNQVGDASWASLFLNDAFFAANGVVNIVRQATGFTTGAANYSAYVKIYRLAG